MRIPDARVVAVAGEAIIDLVAERPGGPYLALPGGSPANVAVGLARLGVPTRMIARIGEDPFGRTLRDHLVRNGVDTRAAAAAAEPSSVAFVHHEAGGPPSYDLRLAGTADWQWTAEELARVPLGDVAALHVGSLAMVLPPGADALAGLVRRARETATIGYDPNCRPDVMAAVPDARARIEALLRTADVVKISDADLEWLRSDAEPRRFAAGLVEETGGVVIVTLGAEGVLVAAPRLAPLHLPARAVEVVDTVGAGDSYMSAVLAGLYERGLLGAERRDALRAAPGSVITEVCAEAARAAAITCGRRGADPPTRAELAASLTT
ncbi:carbohydrate kinase family protein [Actinoallomurus rhizosphaericola]|uniref:carbohydrate kinase family protein n=1 Tax=Actinoallomurus rhizosphaericola TaxID=2952536 RepID=UPI002093C8E0|nr:PfkB family carbohydrate kinase [Actinoallomurus rhizosphaericola]MCO5998209.1 carbohydrate kinase [Actinoallomurus rhizosphaericola]